jgi:DNA-binding CsgD family transcriptional regulator
MSNQLRASFSERLKITSLLVIVIFLVLIHLIMRSYLNAVSLGMNVEILMELPVIVLLFVSIWLLWSRFQKVDAKQSELAVELMNKAAELSQLQGQAEETTSRVRQLIQQNFDQWNLSKSEREIAQLLLQGMSIKEISQFRFTSERTLRNQCRSIYEKSGQAGRHELAAYFLLKLLGDKPRMLDA